MPIKKDEIDDMPSVEREQGCPFWSTPRKTTSIPEDNRQPLICNRDGVWHAYGYAEVRAILRSVQVEQNGWQKGTIARTPLRKLPMLYLEGDAHRRLRRQTARFLSPVTVQNEYQSIMESFADDIIDDFLSRGQADMSELTVAMATAVVREIVGLKNSLRPGMAQRLHGFFKRASIPKLTWHLRVLGSFLKAQYYILLFLLLDVLPAIRKHRRNVVNDNASHGTSDVQDSDEPLSQFAKPKDIISYLIGQGYSNAEIFAECFMYAVAGITTTREFIAVAVWHFLENPAARSRYLASDDQARERILHEILRLEPVATHIYRRAQTNITLDSKGKTIIIPAGASIVLHLQSANDDELIVGPDGEQLCPERTVAEPAQAYMMSFGDGNHKCVGLTLAIQEADIFLQRFLSLSDLRLVTTPKVTQEEISQGYSIRNFVVAVNQPAP